MPEAECGDGARLVSPEASLFQSTKTWSHRIRVHREETWKHYFAHSVPFTLSLVTVKYSYCRRLYCCFPYTIKRASRVKT